MPLIKKLQRLTPDQRALLVQAFFLLAATRLALALLPFYLVRRMLRPLLRPTFPPERRGTDRSASIAWAVTTGAHYIPGATCLTQALAAQVLLSRCGLASHVHIGVARGPGGHFRAHAWVVCQSRVLVGGRGHETFTPLAAFPSHAAR